MLVFSTRLVDNFNFRYRRSILNAAYAKDARSFLMKPHSQAAFALQRYLR